ncbi:hypothetical protein F4X88_11640 [Candidatus Poribacteria bacterium]|nr:hypothetical protein [Candidatus Poribacteria bacterium]MYA56943.1 hypothetical protein [Candidatus Poribacteria bacterium]
MSNALTGDRNTPPEVKAYRENQLEPIWEYQDWDIVEKALEFKGKAHDAEIELAKTRKAYSQFIR